MTRIIQKHLLLLAGLFFLLEAGDISTRVAAFLVGVVITEVTSLSYFKKIRIPFLLMVLAGGICYWPIMLFLPIALYEVMWEKFYYGLFVSLGMVCLWSRLEPMDFAGFLLVVSAALVMAMENGRRMELEQKLREYVDNSKEMESKLRNRNKELMESQDTNIHLAMLQERNRIAREIHDNVGHMLSRSILQMGALQTIYKEEPLHGHLESVSVTLNEAMNNIRESVHDLHDESLDLKQEIKKATREMEQDYLIHMDYDMSDSAPRAVKYCFIAVVKEAMSNVMKHSDGNKVTLLLREHPGFYQLWIEDNGSAAEIDSSSGIGLDNMRQRVENLNGSIHFSTEKGFKIMISIPKNSK